MLRTGIIIFGYIHLFLAQVLSRRWQRRQNVANVSARHFSFPCTAFGDTGNRHLRCSAADSCLSTSYRLFPDATGKSKGYKLHRFSIDVFFVYLTGVYGLFTRIPLMTSSCVWCVIQFFLRVRYYTLHHIKIAELKYVWSCAQACLTNISLKPGCLISTLASCSYVDSERTHRRLVSSSALIPSSDRRSLTSSARRWAVWRQYARTAVRRGSYVRTIIIWMRVNASGTWSSPLTGWYERICVCPMVAFFIRTISAWKHI